MDRREALFGILGAALTPLASRWIEGSHKKGGRSVEWAAQKHVNRVGKLTFLISFGPELEATDENDICCIVKHARLSLIDPEQIKPGDLVLACDFDGKGNVCHSVYYA